jgi:hypothetical protein
MTGGVFLKGLVRKNMICDLNRGHDESDVGKKFRPRGHTGRALIALGFSLFRFFPLLWIVRQLYIDGRQSVPEGRWQAECSRRVSQGKTEFVS